MFGVCVVLTGMTFSTNFVKIEYAGTIGDHMSNPTCEVAYLIIMILVFIQQN